MLTSKLPEYIEKMYEFQMEYPDEAFCPMFLSAPGIGKTQMINDFAKKRGVRVFHLILSQCNPSEVAGMIMPANDGSKMTEIYDPKWAHELQEGDILFLDEILKAPQSVLNSCLTMIEERRLSSNTKLPKVALFAAANPSKSDASIPQEIRQRLVRVPLEFDKDAWSKYVVRTLGLNDNMLGDYTVRLLATRVSHELTDYEQRGTSVWNMATPRTVYKALRMMMTCESKEETLVYVKYMIDNSNIVDFIGHMSEEYFKYKNKKPNPFTTRVYDELTHTLSPDDPTLTELAELMEDDAGFVKLLQDVDLLDWVKDTLGSITVEYEED